MFRQKRCSGMSQTLDEGCTISDDCSTITCEINFVEKPITFKLKVSTVIFYKYPHNMLKVRKNGQQKRATCFATLLYNELNSDVTRFTTHIKPVLQQIRLLTGLNVGGKTRNIAIQLVLQQCCKTSCTFFVARFSVPLWM